MFKIMHMHLQHSEICWNTIQCNFKKQRVHFLVAPSPISRKKQSSLDDHASTVVDVRTSTHSCNMLPL